MHVHTETNQRSCRGELEAQHSPNYKCTRYFLSGSVFVQVQHVLCMFLCCMLHIANHQQPLSIFLFSDPSAAHVKRSVRRNSEVWHCGIGRFVLSGRRSACFSFELMIRYYIAKYICMYRLSSVLLTEYGVHFFFCNGPFP